MQKLLAAFQEFLEVPGDANGDAAGGDANCKWCKKGECWTHMKGKGKGGNEVSASKKEGADSKALLMAKLQKMLKGAEEPQLANGGAAGDPDCRWCKAGECWTHMGKGGNSKKRSYGEPNETSKGKPFSDMPEIKKIKGPFKEFRRTFMEFSEGDLSLSAMQQAESLRTALDMAIDGGPDGQTFFPPVTTFEEMCSLPLYCIEAMMNNGITAPMPIQSQAIPIVLGGMDLVGIAKTGSGKTLAYLLPAVVHIDAQEPIGQWDLSPIVLIMAPTRELAVQIEEEANKLVSTSKGPECSSHPDGLKACCIYGGMQKGDQIRGAMGCQIMSATPGRLHDHVAKGDIDMSRVTYFVLDEGDRMLDDGFECQVTAISDAIRPDRHMLFFSATWPMQVHRLAKKLCKGAIPPVRLRVGQNADGSAKTRDDIMQEVVVFDQGEFDERDKSKKELLFAHVREALNLEGTKVLVFVGQKKLAEEVSSTFNYEGFDSQAMHGGKQQAMREHALEQFKNGTCRLLVATDVMGRGLDIPTVTHVVVYDMGDIEDYVHRIGRTARGPHGSGHALTLFEYDPRWPHLAEGLIKIMESAGSDVPEELRAIAEEVKAGTRETKSFRGRWGKLSGDHGGFDVIQEKTYGSADGLWGTW